MTNQLKTFGQFEELYYQEILKQLGVEGARLYDLLLKADDPVVQSTTGVYTALYGARVHSNLYLQAPTWQILPKVLYETAKSGTRLMTALPTTAAGIAEAGALVDTDKPDIQQYSITLKRMNATWDITEWAQVRSLAEDGKAGGESAWMMDAMADYFVQAVDIALNGQNGVPAGYNFESIDRIVASYAERTNCTDAVDAAYSANDCDIYGIDRDSSAGFSDAIVDYAASNRALSLGLIDNLMVNTMAAGAKPESQVFLTKHDTYGDWGTLMASQQRFTDFVQMQPTVNGLLSDARGREGGLRCAVYNGVPLVLDKNATFDAGGSGRIYLLDTSKLEFRVVNPVRHLVSPVTNAINHDAFTERHSLDLSGEIMALAFAMQGKIRDLS